jgi:hypothetical protein
LCTVKVIQVTREAEGVSKDLAGGHGRNRV